MHFLPKRISQLLAPVAILIILIVGSTVSGDFPAWWSVGDPQSQDDKPVLTDAEPNNHGPANIGQAKHMVKSALDALRPVLPQVALQIEADLAGIVDLTVPSTKTPEWLDKQKAPLLIGQLKAIAHPFYVHLDAAAQSWLAAQRLANGTESGGIFPWTDDPSDDNHHAMANIGQLKAVFSLHFTRDTDGDGMPDLWEIAYGLDHEDPSDADLDAGNNGFSNLEVYILGSAPNTPGDLAARTASTPIQPPAEVHQLVVTGDGGPGEEISEPGPKTVVIPPGGPCYVMMVVVESEEFPRYTRSQSIWNDTVTWSVTVDGDNFSSGSLQVNDFHQSWLEGVASNRSHYGWRPAHYAEIKLIESHHLNPVTVELSAVVTNVEDDLLPTTAILTMVPLDLDVNADGDLDDPCDGLTSYLPGYELDTAKLHTGNSFENSQYSGPQAMNLIIDHLPPDAFDEAFVRLVASNHYGFCENGQIPNESSILPYNDFSLTGLDTVTLFEEATVAVTGDRLVIPVYCHDYGAWSQVEVTLKQNGTVLGEPFIITLPMDRNEDRLADVWQSDEINRWNEQFNLLPLGKDPADHQTWDPVFGPLGANDAEMAKSDGPSGSMPPMADDGDGLTALEEYRGFILDIGNGVSAGQHKRLSVARKEVLLQLHHMPQIVDQSQNNANAAAHQFDLDARFQQVMEFYLDPADGADLDLYAVKISISDEGPSVVYADKSSRPSAYIWNGKLDQDENTARPATGGSYIYHDEKLRSDFPVLHDDLYRAYLPGTSGRRNIFPRLRNHNLPQFGLIAMFSRLGLIEEINEDDGENSVKFLVASENNWGNATTNHGSTVPDPVHEQRGVQLSVNSISEESLPPYTSEKLNEVFDYSLAHEIGHMLIWSQHGGHYGTGLTLMSNVPPNPKNLDTIIIDDGELMLFDLPNRLSTKPKP